MPRGLKSFLQRWLITTLAVLVAVYLVPGIRYDKPLDLLVASLLLGVLNAFLRPLMVLLAWPLLVLTLGLFWWVINAGLLFLVGYLLQPHFSVADFWSAFWGALIISVVSMVVNALTGTGRTRFFFRWRQRPPQNSRDNDNGPIIDV